MRPTLPPLPRSLALLFGLAATAMAAHGSPSPGTGPAPVLVELFTSEGCSNCPPADALLAELEGAHAASGAEVIVVGEHVDYWDRLGWADPYSSPSFTRRQEDYAAALRQPTVYTPQVVVDGTYEGVGSDRNQVWKAITAASARPKARMSLTRLQDDHQEASLQVRIDGLRSAAGDGPAVLYLAITEDGLQSRVTRGANAGRVLIHAAVLRRLTRIAVLDPGKDTFAATVQVPLDPVWKRQSLRAVGFLQGERSGRILGAVSGPLNPD